MSSGQDGGIGGNTSLPCTTKKGNNNLKTINNLNCQKVEQRGTLLYLFIYFIVYIRIYFLLLKENPLTFHVILVWGW